MKLLILGGTNDALCLANNLYTNGIEVVYSLAGLVRIPEVEYTVVSGGFAQYGGLDKYLTDTAIDAVLDATHPYANLITKTAMEVAIEKHLPYWRFDRPAWQPQASDQWFDFNDWSELCSKLADNKSIFVTTGRLDQTVLSMLSNNLCTQILVRSAIKQSFDGCENIRWLQAIGPFSVDDEISLMQNYKVDVLVSKNSGGQATVAKLEAARELQIPVYMLKRPQYKPVFKSHRLVAVLSDIDACENKVLRYFNQFKLNSVIQ